MQPIKKLTVPEYLELQSQVAVMLEKMQNHYISEAMEGATRIDQFNDTRAAELVLRAMKVGITNGIQNYTNIVYMMDKLQQAIDYLLNYQE